jgi:four helix bundle protein
LDPTLEKENLTMARFLSRSFRDLIVWQKAHQFVLAVYRYTRQFPKEEIYSLTAQFRRAAVSTPANIAEGFKKRTKSDKARFMNISQGSLEECRYYLILAEDLGYGDNSHLMSQLEEVSKLLESYTRAILISRG